MSKVSTLPPLTETQEKQIARLTPEQLEEVAEISHLAIGQFKGQADKLETALGALVLGYQVGWRVLYIVHNKRTIRQYETILGITFREHFKEEGLGSSRSLGYKIAKKLEKFWQVVSGDIKIEGKREISD
jgi:hypothetical protein